MPRASTLVAVSWFVLVASFLQAAQGQDSANRQAEIERFKQEVANSPNDASARIKLGNTLDDAGDSDGAILQYLAAIRLDPKNAVAHRNIGVTYARKGDLKAAEFALREALRLAPDYTSARLTLVEVLWKRKDGEGVLTQLREGLEQNRSETVGKLVPDWFPVEKQGLEQAKVDAAAHALLAELAFSREQDVDRASKELRKAVEMDPQFAVGYQILAATYEQQDKKKEALSAALAALRLNPNLPNAHFTAGNIYGKTGKSEDAIREYQASVQIMPGFAKGHVMLGELYSKLERHSEAINAYNQALSADPNFDARDSVHNNLAIEYYRTGQYTQAWQHVREAQRLGYNVHPGFLAALRKAAPEEGPASSTTGSAAGRASNRPPAAVAGEASAHLHRGAELLSERRHYAAACEFQKALQIDPAQPAQTDVHAFLAYIFGSLGKFPAAWNEVRLARQFGGTPEPELLEPGLLAMLRKGKPESIALQEFQELDRQVNELKQAITGESGRAELHSRLGTLLEKQGQFNAAAEEYRLALRLDAKLADAHFFLGTLASRDRDTYGEAIEYLSLFLRDTPQTPERAERIGAAHSNLARIYEETGRETAAAGEYEQGANAEPMNPRHWNNAAWLYATAKDMQARNPQKALEYAKKAVELSNGNEAAYLDTLAEAYFVNGQFDEAIRTERRALSSQPKLKVLHEQLEKFKRAKQAKKR